VKKQLAIALGALGFVGCGQPANSLTGSLDEIAPLQFDSTVVRADPDVLVIEYDRFPQAQGTQVDAGPAATGAGGTDVVFKVAIQIAGLQLNKDLDLDLTSATSDGTPRTSCTRAVGTDPRRDLPPVKRGELVRDSDVNIGQPAKGHFHILFGEGGEIGEGRTVDGTFSAPAQDANPWAQP
jgi:hypothetical protein